jgi:transcriptional regulator with PAS, ATPase and Fis domain
MQVKLLRVLQEREFEPLGATSPVKADVRVIAATKEDLATLVEKGVFRDDLYFRLNVVKLALPSLRERRDDIPLLVDHFIEKFNRKMGRLIRNVSDDVLSLLMLFDFPGNVRQLENFIEHAFVMCRGEEIQLQHLPPELSRHQLNFHENPHIESPFQDAEHRTILEILRRYNWNKIETARELGVHRATLYRKMKKYGLM